MADATTEVKVHAVKKHPQLGGAFEELPITDAAELEQTVDAAIAAFDEYFQRDLGNDPLVKGEKAIIKTFLHFHLVPKRKTDEPAAT